MYSSILTLIMLRWIWFGRLWHTAAENGGTLVIQLNLVSKLSALTRGLCPEKLQLNVSIYFPIISLLTRSKPSTIYLKPYLHYFQLDQILMLSTVHTLWFLVNFTIDTFTALTYQPSLIFGTPILPHTEFSLNVCHVILAQPLESSVAASDRGEPWWRLWRVFVSDTMTNGEQVQQIVSQ